MKGMPKYNISKYEIDTQIFLPVLIHVIFLIRRVFVSEYYFKLKLEIIIASLMLLAFIHLDRVYSEDILVYVVSYILGY